MYVIQNYFHWFCCTRFTIYCVFDGLWWCGFYYSFFEMAKKKKRQLRQLGVLSYQALFSVFTCYLHKMEFYDKSKDIFNFMERSEVVEERNDEDKRPIPIVLNYYYHRRALSCRDCFVQKCFQRWNKPNQGKTHTRKMR